MTVPPPCASETPAPPPHPRRPPVDAMRALLIAVWAVPILVLGQFAMLAVAPVVFVVVRTARDARLRALRWWAALLGAAYATPLVLWAIGPDRAPSLSKDMGPVVTAVLVVVSVVVAVAFTVTAAPRRDPLRRAFSDRNGLSPAPTRGGEGERRPWRSTRVNSATRAIANASTNAVLRIDAEYPISRTSRNG